MGRIKEKLGVSDVITRFFGWRYCGDCPRRDCLSTIFKDNSTLQSEGWIEATGNLVAAHDAATAYLAPRGACRRMRRWKTSSPNAPSLG